VLSIEPTVYIFTQSSRRVRVTTLGNPQERSVAPLSQRFCERDILEQTRKSVVTTLIDHNKAILRRIDPHEKSAIKGCPSTFKRPYSSSGPTYYWSLCEQFFSLTYWKSEHN
jgi:hypothetical protein